MLEQVGFRVCTPRQRVSVTTRPCRVGHLSKTQHLVFSPQRERRFERATTYGGFLRAHVRMCNVYNVSSTAPRKRLKGDDVSDGCNFFVT